MQHSHNFYLILENQTMNFSYTIFPVKKINVGKILKFRENRYLIILSIHILKLEISGCDSAAGTGAAAQGQQWRGWRPALPTLRFDPAESRERGSRVRPAPFRGHSVLAVRE
jgi:hypothetical protein